jgi:hypothetical protein
MRRPEFMMLVGAVAGLPAATTFHIEGLRCV